MSELTNTSLIQRGVNAIKSKLFWRWSLITIVSTLISPMSLMLYAIADELGITLSSNPSLLLIISLLNGLVSGFLQWIVLRKAFRRAYWWIVATGLGHMAFSLLLEKLGVRMLETLADLSVGNTAAFFEGSLARILTGLSFIAVIIGGAQWLFLRRQLDDIRLWIPAVFVAQLLLLPGLLTSELQYTRLGFLLFVSIPMSLTLVIQLAKSVVTGFVLSLPTGLLLADAIARKS